MTPLALEAVNALPREAFVARFGDIAEHSPWVAERAAAARPYADVPGMVAAFQLAVRQASEQEQRALLRAHPSLAGRAALAGAVAESSRREQAGAGLDQLTAEEFARFSDLNSRYEARFGFPFILAVKGADKHIILAAFAARVDGGWHEEFLTGLAQVCRIIRFRLEAAVA
jgi:2-oxo-4-hydroxy-4-carboxy-5-ureidoimidazoline decarboxylase